MKRWILFWHTIRHLQARQLVFQVFNRLRPKPRLSFSDKKPVIQRLNFPLPDKPESLSGTTFTFLNRSVDFPNEVVWNYDSEGRLWKYNLNYFDFLNQPGMSPAKGLDLIRQFIRQTDRLNGGLEPYPTSLRIINWVRFLSYHQLALPDVNRHLLAQVRLLEGRLEHHLSGNHLLENAFTLFTAAVSFQDRKLYRNASELLKKELKEQILADGGHYERSPMYHQILLDRLLDLCTVLLQDRWHDDPPFDAGLLRLGSRMLGWLQAMTFRNGDSPMVNDATSGIAPSTQHLIAKARVWAIEPEQTTLSESGYRMFRMGDYELLADVGAVGPDHQPGHAHADTFGFVLYVRGLPVVVDAGTSTYEANARRQWERSTAAHNTVQVANTDSSEVWGGFRVARRAAVKLLQDSATHLRAEHDGYRLLGITHERNWQFADQETLLITDRLRGVVGHAGIARLHFHPSVPVSIHNKVLAAGPLQIRLLNVSIEQASVESYEYAAAFNRLQPASCVKISFTDTLKLSITVTE
jgi:uncharacterized heparinase superfamily protein